MNGVSREGHTTDEVKKKWFHLKSDTKKSTAKFRRVMQSTGGRRAGKELSELDQHFCAIIRETALSGVPSAECLDTDLTATESAS